ncbi:MAG: hypothetical protein II998_09835 [Clostridia bacterium]|nr:hypothetical protein [Clostridia bacterium]
MVDDSVFLFTENKRKQYIERLVEELPLLRAKAEVSQEEIAFIIGVSRQTYGAIERKSRTMSWSIYLSLVFFFDYNKKTRDMIRSITAFPKDVTNCFSNEKISSGIELESMFNPGTKNIIDALDDQAKATIKTLVMLEYSRCTKLSGEAVIKLFEGMDFSGGKLSQDSNDTARALKNIKRNSTK